jgi:hypothetical protein
MHAGGRAELSMHRRWSLDRGTSASNLDTRAQELVTRESVEHVGLRFET